MPYQANIPQPNDPLNQSQGDILGNFQAIDTLVSVDHATFGSASEGKHNKISFPVQGAAPAFLAGEVGIYNLLSIVTGVNELYIVNSAGGLGSITSSIISTNAVPGNNTAGWTYLPSGLLLKWGNGNANGNSAIVFPVAANIPVFVEVMSVQLTTFVNSAADSDTFVRLSSFTNLGFNCYGSQRTVAAAAACSFQYLAIGY